MTMTVIELMVRTFLMGCASLTPADYVWHGETYTVESYACPLSVPDTEIGVLYHVCQITKERHAVALWDDKKRIGWVLDQFGSALPAYQNIDVLTIYNPLCG